MGDSHNKSVYYFWLQNNTFLKENPFSRTVSNDFNASSLRPDIECEEQTIHSFMLCCSQQQLQLNFTLLSFSICCVVFFIDGKQRESRPLLQTFFSQTINFLMKSKNDFFNEVNNRFILC